MDFGKIIGRLVRWDLAPELGFGIIIYARKKRTHLSGHGRDWLLGVWINGEIQEDWHHHFML